MYTDHDRKALHFLEEGLHFLTHFDGKFFTTVKTIFTRPGQLSLDYTFGIRKKYFKLLSLFLLLVVLYLLFPLFEGLNMQLYYHVRHPMYGGFAREKALEVMSQRHLTDAAMSALFHQASEKTSKILLLILIPLTALGTWAITFKKRKYLFDQLVFATEVNCFYLMWGFLLLPLLLMVVAGLWQLFFSGVINFNDQITGPLVAAPLVAFAAVAGRRFFSLGKWESVLFAFYFVLLHAFIVQFVYKFALFVTVINQM